MAPGEVFIGLLALADLLLIMLLTRKVRALTSLANQAPGSGRPPWLPAGSQIADFDATTTDGTVLSLHTLLGKPSMVGFFSTNCEPCRHEIGAFATHLNGNGAHANGDHARGRQPQAANVVAVIVGDGPDAGRFEAQVAGKALIVKEGHRGSVSAAFSAHAFPGIYLLDADGKVTGSGPSIAVARTEPHRAGRR